ncbi:uncharacterized protein UHOD_11386 [Ustilago sp. UG-2017b]|nr:uncharacterized protein UHOD_11386 [Ustilago sp. UG-2017b]
MARDRAEPIQRKIGIVFLLNSLNTVMSPNQSPTSSTNSPSTMSNIDYSIYDAFVVPVQLFPRLPKILQNRFNQVMEDKLTTPRKTVNY